MAIHDRKDKNRTSDVCIKCGVEKSITLFPWRDKSKGFRRGECQECTRACHSKYQSTLEYKEYQKNYRQTHKNERNQHDMERKATDVNYRLSVRLRKRLNRALVCNLKSGSAVNDLGCTISELKQYLESKFQPGMNWDNWGNEPGTWQIDHIIPLSSFDLNDPEQLKKACRYTNLQPLWYDNHLKKTTEERLTFVNQRLGG